MAPPQRTSLLRILCALVAGAMLLLQAVVAAEKRMDVLYEADSTSGNYSSSVAMVNPRVTQGSSLLKAEKADVTNLEDINNSTWKFSGNVHVEFDGATMDAHTVTAVFVDGRLSTLFLESAQQQTRKPVHVVFKSSVLDVDNARVTLVNDRIRTILALGTPSRFSYVHKKPAQQVSGRASKIEYDGEKDSIRFSGDTWFTDGKNESTASSLTYNFTSDLAEALHVKLLLRPPEDRLPQILPPDRATAR
jgi:lipopolysaccharide transport protein LptA